ncbi:hypothetical protein [Streptosporangium vulgare]|uniref:hypothetical protein n=1 Tax=Streptosporangium vulgare TaxID=46190 RepID=UPI0031E3A987
MWTPFLRRPTCGINLILPGLVNTLSAGRVAAVIAVPFGGFVFGIGRRLATPGSAAPRGRSSSSSGDPAADHDLRGDVRRERVFGLTVTPFLGGGVGLVLYNGSVLAEIVRAGILSIPRGQSEAALGVGMRPGQVMRYPAAAGVTVMMPAIVAQLVVLLKDTALGFIVSSRTC